MSTDPGSTHYVGDGCQPAHDPRIDAEPIVLTDAQIIYDFGHEIGRLKHEVERLTVELTHRVGWEERCLDAEAALATLRAEIARLRAVAHAANGAFLAFAKAPPELADDHELTRAMSTLGAALDSYDTLRESS